MTVPAQTPINRHTGNGVSTIFPFTFKVLQADDLEVSIGGVVQSTGFTVSGVGANSGDVTFTAPPAAGAVVVLRRVMAIQRTTDYQDQGAMPAATVDDDHDATVMMVQQVAAAQSSALQYPVLEGISGTLPAAADRAGKLLAFNGDGLPVMSAPASGSAVELAIDLASSGTGKGAQMVAFDGETVDAALIYSKAFGSYSALRSYTGNALGARITAPGIAGLFYLDNADTTTADDGGCVIVDASGRRWKRLFVGDVYPEWFGAVGDGVANDYTPIAAAVAYVTGKRNTLQFTQRYALGSTLSIPADVQTNADRRSVFFPFGGLADAVILAAGNANGRQVLPQFSGFSGVALDVRCNLGDVYVTQFVNCGTAIKMHSGSTTGAKLLDTIVRFNSISTCGIAVNYHHGDTGAVMQGCKVEGNFVTATTDCVVFTGAAAPNDGQIFDVLAVDFTAGGGAFMDNRIGTAVPRFQGKVRSWFGGNGFDDTTPTKLAKGGWTQPRLEIIDARSFNQNHLDTNLWRGARVEWGQIPTAAATVNCVTLATGLAGFNSGNMLYRDKSLMRITTDASIAAGGTAAFYLWHILADANYPFWQAQLTAASNGLIIDSIVDQSTTEAGRVRINVRNITGSSIAAGAVLTFLLERF